MNSFRSGILSNRLCSLLVFWFFWLFNWGVVLLDLLILALGSICVYLIFEFLAFSFLDHVNLHALLLFLYCCLIVNCHELEKRRVTTSIYF